MATLEPHYIRVQNELRHLIHQGVYKEGDSLPSENELSAQYGITRMTIRNALSGLEVDGLIQKKKGLGSIVQPKRKSLGLLSIKGFAEVAKRDNLNIETIIIQKPSIQPWPDDFYYELTEIERSAGCIMMERLRKINDEPVMFEETYIPNMNLPKFCTKPFVNNSLFDTLQVNYNIAITLATQSFRAMIADEDLKQALQLASDQPLLHIIRKLETNREGMSIYSSVYFNSENHSIEI